MPSSVCFCAYCCPFQALLSVPPSTQSLWDDGLSPSCCSFTHSVPPEAERWLNKWTETLPLQIPFCFLTPMVHPPPAVQKWSSLITLLPGCSVLEQPEGRKERKWDSPGEGRRSHRELVKSIFVLWNEIWACSMPIVLELRNRFLFVLPNFKNVCDSSPLAHSNAKDAFH